MGEIGESHGPVERSLDQGELKRVFVVGCPRSGTTWAQLLLAQHPEVATSQETHLFSRYLRPLERLWMDEKEAPASLRRVGLRNIFSEAEFYGLCRVFAVRVFEKIAASRPGARVAVEKTPAHVRCGDLILKVFPASYFIHIIRDPRSVVCSLRSSARSWGSRWAPKGLVEASERWRSDVATGRQIAKVTGRYQEVFYEALLDEGPAQLGKILSWLNLPADRSFCEKAVAACAIENLRKASPEVASPWSLRDEPSGFFGTGTSQGWQEELSPGDLGIVEYIAGGLMEQLGYRLASKNPRRKPLRLLLGEASGWARKRRK